MQISQSVGETTEQLQRTEAGQFSLSVPRALVILTAVYGLVSFWNLELQTVSNPDEPRLAFAAREMLRGQDWMIPQFNAQQHLTKPIFFYWLIAVTGLVGQHVGMGISAAFRLGPILMGYLGALAVFFVGLRLRNIRYAFFSAAILITSFTFHRITRLLVVDMTLLGFLMWSWYWFILTLDRLDAQKSAFATLLAFYICLGFACMTKGPGVVAVFVVVPVCLLLWWDGKLNYLGRAGLWWGAPLALLIGHWWFIALALRGLDMKRNFLVENFGRLGGLDHQRPVPFVFYIEAVLGAFAPWTVFLPFAMWAAFREWRERTAAPLSRHFKMLCCCLLFPFFAIGVAVTKRPLYALPLYPFLSLFLARYFELNFFNARVNNPVRAWVKALPFIFPLILAGGVAFAIRHFDVPPDIAWAPLSICIFILIALFAYMAPRAAARGDWLKMASIAVCLSASIVFAYEAIMTPTIERQRDAVAFYDKIAKVLKDRKLIIYADNTNEAVWFLDRPNVEVAGLKRDLSHPGPIVLENTAVLCASDTLNHTPELKEALVPELRLIRNKDEFTLGAVSSLRNMIVIHNFATNLQLNQTE